MISFITPTHNTRFIEETYYSLLKQTNKNWEWIIVPNGNRDNLDLGIFGFGDKKVKVLWLPEELEGKGIGAIKQWSFMQGTGNYLAELDHDDLLTPTAVEDIEDAFTRSQSDFVYSNSADFFPNGHGHWFPDWYKNGWRYRDTTIDGKWYNECISFHPSAAALSLIYYAPNHIRVWEKDFYHKISGHNPNYKICDDHELLIRTYLHGKMHHIDKCLYLYRMGEQNTFSKNIEEIRGLTYGLYTEYLERLIIREAQIKHLPIYDLGGGFGCPPEWQPVDIQKTNDRIYEADLTRRWPWEDNSVFAFRAHDIFEHLPDKIHTMRELHRCLKPGGWALISVPSTDGRGAFQDPTHVSYWNENSFWYYTRQDQAQYIQNTSEHFIESRLFTYFPSEWHKASNISYTKAELIAVKESREGIPGVFHF